MKRSTEILNAFKNVNGEYTIHERVGGGSFGDVFIGKSMKDGKKFAIKFEKKSQFVYQTLPKEAQVLTIMRDTHGYAKFEKLLSENEFNVLIMNLLGPNLEKLFRHLNSKSTLSAVLTSNIEKFSVKSVIMIALSMIERIEAFHSKNLLHRDIKPENFVVGSGVGASTIFIIDFGLARLFKNAEGRHIKKREGNGLIGTARYCSVNAHLGRELSRRDDLESIGYTLIYFLKGKLPWQSVKGKNRKEKYKRIKKKKMSITPQELCEGVPECFLVYLEYVKNLNFAETPSYSHLKKIFKKTLANYALELDYQFDWVSSKNQIQGDSFLVKGEEVKENKKRKAVQFADNDLLEGPSPLGRPSGGSGLDRKSSNTAGILNGKIRLKKRRATRQSKNGALGESMTLNMENDSNNPESTIFGTSKYLNHTQLRNETESLSLLNTRLVSKNGGKSTAIEEYKSNGIIEEEMDNCELEEDKQFYNPYPAYTENANESDLKEFESKSDIFSKIMNLEQNRRFPSILSRKTKTKIEKGQSQ